MSKAWGFIKDPIHGYVRISDTERTIIDTRPVQRLRRLRQLAGSEFVYPAANHTRFEHVVGAMHLAGVLSEVLPTHLDVHIQEPVSENVDRRGIRRMRVLDNAAARFILGEQHVLFGVVLVNALNRTDVDARAILHVDTRFRDDRNPRHDQTTSR